MNRKVYPRFRDCRGAQIKLGDTIAYPSYTKSILSMKTGVVCEVPGKGCTTMKGIVIFGDPGKRITITRPDRCIVVKRFEELQ